VIPKHELTRSTKMVNIFSHKCNLGLNIAMLPLRLGRGWQRFNSTRLRRHDLDQTSRLIQRRLLHATQSRYSHSGHNHHRTPTSPWIFYPTCAVILGAACFITYQTSQPFRHSVLAALRCSRVAGEYILVGNQLHCTVH
jgi:hypothetical protein